MVPLFTLQILPSLRWLQPANLIYMEVRFGILVTTCHAWTSCYTRDLGLCFPTPSVSLLFRAWHLAIPSTSRSSKWRGSMFSSSLPARLKWKWNWGKPLVSQHLKPEKSVLQRRLLVYAEWSGVIDKDMKLTKTETMFACFIDFIAWMAMSVNC